MGSCDQIESIYVVEVVCDFGAEDPAGSSGIDGPVLDIFGVGPHEIGERTFVGDFDLSIDGSDLVDGLDFRAETSVDTECFSVDDCSEREVVEDFSTVFPGVGVSVFSVDFVIETIDSGNLSALG